MEVVNLVDAATTDIYNAAKAAKTDPTSRQNLKGIFRNKVVRSDDALRGRSKEIPMPGGTTSEPLQSLYWEMRPIDSPKYAQIASALDESGDAYPYARLFKEELIVVPSSEMSAKCDGRNEKLPDCINSITSELVISNQAADLFRQFRMGNTKFFPIRILDSKRQRTIGEAELVVSCHIDYVDLKQSSFKSLSKDPDHPIVWCYTAPPVVYGNLLRGLDLAQSQFHCVPFVCSNELKNSIEERKFSGFEFKPLDVR